MSDKKQTVRSGSEDEPALDISQEKYRILFDAIDEGFVICELLFDDEGKPFDLRVLDANASFERLMRTTTSSVGKRALEIFPQAEASWFQAYGHVVETGAPLRTENYLAALDAWFDMYISRIGEAGSHRFAIVFQDITERKRAEKALRQSEAWHRTLFDSVDEAVCVFERLPTRPDGRRDYRYLAMNPAMQAMFGIPNLSGQSIRDNFPDEVEAWYDDYDRVLETGQPIRFERESAPQGVVLEMFVTRLEDGSGRRLLAVMQDVTQRKRAEEALEQKVEEKTAEVRQLASDLVKAAQGERQRISQVLHDDLQQRIYAIRMQLMVLRDTAQKGQESVQVDTSTIEAELDEVLKITRYLSIDLSPPILRGEGLSQAIEWLAGRMQQQYGLRVELQAEQDVVIADHDLHVLLFNSIRELLFNAVKHGKARNATVTLQRSEDRLRIEVKDDGQGFPVQSSQEQDSHSLGLPSVRHQLSLLGGSLEVESTPGSGARVIITVPLS